MEELKTSDEWYKLYPSPIIRDPDGWDRKDYEYSWFEENMEHARWAYLPLAARDKK